MDTPGISLCMIVRNEAQHLEQCLLSVQGRVSEIIIADTGSEDNSMAIARRFGARVIRLPWEHDFSKARNHTLQLASYGWILVLDADEALADWKLDDLQSLLESERADGYFLPFIHYVGEGSGREYVTDNVCRLFRNDSRICFRGSIHEEVASSIWSLPGGHIAYAHLPVHHYGYLDDELQRKNKASRNLELIHAALRLEPDSVPLRYALGTEYYQQGQYQAAADLLLPLLEEAPPESGYTADLYLKTAFALQAGGRPVDAESVYRAGIGLYADFTDLLESYAGLLLEQGQVWRAYPLLQQALDSGDTAHKYPSSSGSGTSRTRMFAGRVCERLFLFEEALEHYRQAISYAPDDPAAWEQLATLCLLSGQTEQLTAFTRQLLPALPRRVLSRLVPAALNARAAPWLAALCAAPHLPEDIRQVLQVLLGTLFRDPEQPGAASAGLARMRGICRITLGYPAICGPCPAAAAESPRQDKAWGGWRSCRPGPRPIRNTVQIHRLALQIILTKHNCSFRQVLGTHCSCLAGLLALHIFSGADFPCRYCEDYWMHLLHLSCSGVRITPGIYNTIAFPVMLRNGCSMQPLPSLAGRSRSLRPPMSRRCANPAALPQSLVSVITCCFLRLRFTRRGASPLRAAFRGCCL